MVPSSPNTISNKINLADCTEYDEWSSRTGTYLAGRAQDASGAELSNWADDMYSDLNIAKRECVLLNSRGGVCGGVTGQYSGGYSLRLGSSFIQSPSGEFSYLKPNGPCEGKY